MTETWGDAGRGTASAIGSILLVGVVIALSVTVGMTVLSFTERAEETTKGAGSVVAFAGEWNGSALEITYVSGDSMDGDHLVVRNANATVPDTVRPGTTFSAEPTGDRVLVVRTGPGSPSVVAAFDVPAGRNDTGDTGSPYFDVSGIDVRNAQCNSGTSTGTVVADVTNTGDVADTQAVELRVEGTVVATKSVTLDPGERTRVTFSSVTADTGDCRTTVVVASADDQVSTSLPGFGLAVAVGALAVAALWLRGRG